MSLVIWEIRVYLTTFKEKFGYRTWKGFDWDVMNRLYEKGYISDPKSKAKSVAMPEEGFKLSEKLFTKHFGVDPEQTGKTEEST